MKILIPILGFAKQGGYRVLSELANAWIDLGHQCTFLAPETSDLPYFPTKAEIIFCSFHLNTAVNNVGRRASGFDNIISLYCGLRRMRDEYDVIFANHSMTTWPVYFAAGNCVKKMYYIQAYEPGYYKFQQHPIKHILAKLSYILPFKQISNSNTYRGVGISPVAVIPPGIDTSIFFPKTNYIDISEKSNLIIGTIGRTEPYKGTGTAIAAYRALGKCVSNAQMKIAFRNVDFAEDYEIVDINGDAELADYYRSLDVLLVTCYSQHGAPHYPLIEAMSCGTPVVQTNYYPGNEFNSWPCAGANVEAVVKGILEFISSSKEERMNKIALSQSFVACELAWKEVARKFIKIFDA